MHPKSTPSDVIVVPLTKGQSTIIDAVDAPLVTPYPWQAWCSKYGRWYAQRNFTVENGKRVKTLLHRHILRPPDGVLVDHINGDSLDNRRCNLRLVTRAQNTFNSRPNRGGTSRYKGVSWNRGESRWQSKIHHEGTTHFLGLFSSEEHAARAYDAAARELFGEWAFLNFPDHDSN